MQIVVQKTKTVNENPNNNYDSIHKSQHFLILCLNAIGSQQEISTTRLINYLLNLLDHITNHDFTYLPWHNLSTWANELKKIKMFTKKQPQKLCMSNLYFIYIMAYNF